VFVLIVSTNEATDLLTRNGGPPLFSLLYFAFHLFLP